MEDFKKFYLFFFYKILGEIWISQSSVNQMPVSS